MKMKRDTQKAAVAAATALAAATLVTVSAHAESPPVTTVTTPVVTYDGVSIDISRTIALETFDGKIVWIREVDGKRQLVVANSAGKVLFTRSSLPKGANQLALGDDANGVPSAIVSGSSRSKLFRIDKAAAATSPVGLAARKGRKGFGLRSGKISFFQTKTVAGKRQLSVRVGSLDEVASKKIWSAPSKKGSQSYRAGDGHGRNVETVLLAGGRVAFRSSASSDKFLCSTETVKLVSGSTVSDLNSFKQCENAEMSETFHGIDGSDNGKLVYVNYGKNDLFTLDPESNISNLVAYSASTGKTVSSAATTEVWDNWPGVDEGVPGPVALHMIGKTGKAVGFNPAAPSGRCVTANDTTDSNKVDCGVRLYISLPESMVVN